MEKVRQKRSPAIEVPKTFSLKVIETLESLQLLRDSIRAVRQGKIYHLAVLSGQMRSLLIDRSKHAEQRLFYVAEKLGVSLTAFCMQGVDDPEFPLTEKPLFWVSGFPISTERQLAKQREMALEDILGEPFLLYRGTKYTPRKIIEWFANKAGGSHYSASLPREFAEMLTLQLGSLQPLRNMLLQLAEATLLAGLKLLRAAVQQEVHLLLGVPSRPNGEVYLIDAAYPDSPMRLSLMLDSRGSPVARLVGLDGAVLTLVGNRFVDWDRVRHLHLSITVSEELSTRAELHLDGESLGWVESKAPIFLTPHWEDYDVFHNRAVTGEPQNFSFALGELVVVGAKHSPSDRANMLLYEEERRSNGQTKLALYEPRSFARSAPGERDLKMQGGIKLVTAHEVVYTASPA